MALETYELVISGTLAGQFVQTVTHVVVDDANAANPFERAEEVIDSLEGSAGFLESWTNALPVQYSITSIRCRRVLPTGGPTFIALAGDLTVSAGQRTGNISSAQVNPVLVWITTPRPNKPGRVFLPGISESDIDAMTYTPTIIGLYNTLITAVLTSLNVGSDIGNFCVLRRATGQSDMITHGRISPLVGTQRRRLHPV